LCVLSKQKKIDTSQYNNIVQPWCMSCLQFRSTYIFVLFLTTTLNRCSCWFFVRICVQSSDQISIDNTKCTSLIQSSQKSLFSDGTYIIRDTNKTNEFCIAHSVRQMISIWLGKINVSCYMRYICLKYKIIFFDNFCKIWQFYSLGMLT